MTLNSEQMREAIVHIAEAADAIAYQAGIGGTETAGMIISYLANNPDKINVFLKEGWIDAVGHDDPWSSGCLTWHRKGDGKIVSPQERRISQTVRDIVKSAENPSP